MALASQVRVWLSGPTGRWVAVAVASAALALAGLRFAGKAGPTPAEAIRARGRTYPVICQACRQAGQIRTADDPLRWPQECPACHQRAAVLAFRCLACDQVIASPQTVFECPHCHRRYDNRPLAQRGEGDPERQR